MMYVGDPTQRRCLGIGGALAVGAAASWLAGRRVRRLTVSGASMEPTLREGDRLLVLSGTAPRAGDLIALQDPRGADPAVGGRLIVKRLAAIGPDGLDVRGDAPSRSTDSRTFGPVPAALVEGTVVWRYAPSTRAGRIARGPRASRR